MDCKPMRQRERGRLPTWRRVPYYHGFRHPWRCNIFHVAKTETNVHTEPPWAPSGPLKRIALCDELWPAGDSRSTFCHAEQCVNVSLVGSATAAAKIYGDDDDDELWPSTCASSQPEPVTGLPRGRSFRVGLVRDFFNFINCSTFISIC
jgi:hypothetical protein